MESLPAAVPWPPLQTLMRLTLALAVGLFVGLEREWRGKEAGLRTFGFASLLGGLGGLLGTPYAILGIALLGVLIAFLNWQSLQAQKGAELTTSAALLVTGFTGVLCGLGHTVTPAAVAVTSAGLLAWKERLAGFSHKITAEELRSAILLAILAFAIYPVLPAQPVDPWGLIEPRAAWVTVILIAAIGFVNYLLWKVFGAHGVEVTGFLGGLVNSTVTVTELANRVREMTGQLLDVVYRGVMLATAAMALRNAVLLGLLSLGALVDSALPLALILLSSTGLALVRFKVDAPAEGEAPALPLKSPFSLPSALKFGFIFLVLQVVGTVGQNLLGRMGFYAVSAVGGLVSSASAVASAASLCAHGKISPAVAGTGAIIATLASAVVNIVLVARVSEQRSLSLRLGRALGLVVVLGLVGAFVQSQLLELIHWRP
ncbi:MgtC/SapB family protein [Vitiosangium sp. GDMCC 1.1324]|uniref:MgtC/SapB family protein n=1 Tax=Vitiosangium sp. (strain GDMCC 1.1324) TaxID=2138576 RepID=UPI000D35EC05|nr:MgtC/SapB family protein [Vitiosangium sp. GDMCC 1.1324]PTL78997.1 magnesium transporter accessory protein [Vitiosangium sp. GDMCC 1.1324]